MSTLQYAIEPVCGDRPPRDTDWRVMHNGAEIFRAGHPDDCREYLLTTRGSCLAQELMFGDVLVTIDRVPNGYRVRSNRLDMNFDVVFKTAEKALEQFDELAEYFECAYRTVYA